MEDKTLTYTLIFPTLPVTPSPRHPVTQSPRHPVTPSPESPYFINFSSYCCYSCG
ncbi:hypothetical protein [Crocosphaera watsonii]|uniref:Lysine decarboxylase n=1 Tax=Crocosphaera watsonii WH 0401 TaxID=555881 RepID=T2JB94_CROWT|nr:hypothetical protein [Crocosphaera watsonii]CCQ62299.1 Lysine decarboxylase [Crocosphaera watsonii WH 0401]